MKTVGFHTNYVREALVDTPPIWSGAEWGDSLLGGVFIEFSIKWLKLYTFELYLCGYILAVYGTTCGTDAAEDA